MTHTPRKNVVGVLLLRRVGDSVLDYSGLPSLSPYPGKSPVEPLLGRRRSQPACNGTERNQSRTTGQEGSRLGEFTGRGVCDVGLRDPGELDDLRRGMGPKEQSVVTPAPQGCLRGRTEVVVKDD